MRKLLIIEIIAGCLLAGGAVFAGDRSPVVSEFVLSPKLCQSLVANHSTLRFQMVVLRLNKGTVYFSEERKIRLVEATSKHGGAFRHQMMLEKGDYLLEYLLYSPEEDRYELLARNIVVDKPPRGETIALTFPVDGLRQPDFKKYRRILLANPERRDRAFLDHMLWFAVRNVSRRAPEDQVELFARLKPLSAQLNYAPAGSGRGLGMQRDAASLQGVNSYIVAEACFKIAVRTDNLRELLDLWNPAGRALDPRDLATLKEVSEEAREIVREGKFLGLVATKGASPDAAPDGRTGQAESPLEQKERLEFLAASLEKSVMDAFFNEDRAVSLDRFNNPLDIAGRLDTVAREAIRPGRQ
jgi:hypothetical protein